MQVVRTKQSSQYEHSIQPPLTKFKRRAFADPLGDRCPCLSRRLVARHFGPQERAQADGARYCTVHAGGITVLLAASCTNSLERLQYNSI